MTLTDQVAPLNHFDCRTRRADDVLDVDATGFHSRQVPELLDRNRSLATAAFAASGLTSMTIAVDGEPWCWHLDDAGSLVVESGDPGLGAHAALSSRWFSDIVNDLRSTTAAMIANDVDMVRGNVTHLVAWEPVLRALVDARPAYQEGLVGFTDRSGRPLDLDTSFTLEDDPDEIVHFLSEAGFVHLRGVFTPAEMTDLDAEIERWRAEMTPDDNRAWYANVGEEQVCVRVTNLPVDAVDFPHAEGLSPIADMVGAGHRYGSTDLLVKPIGVTDGLSDLPWHKDCALGGHSYRCTSLTCGVSVTESGADNGQLGVLAGSHRVNIAAFERTEGLDLPAVWLSTEPGDVTVHVSCALHSATPPVHSQRKVTYSSMRLPGSDDIEKVIGNVRDTAGRRTYAPK